MAPQQTEIRGSSNGSTFFFRDDLPVAARLFIALIILLGIPVLLASVYNCVMQPDSSWFYLVALTAVTSLFAVKIQILCVKSQSFTISVGDVFVFVALLIFSVETAAAVAGVEVLISSLKNPVKRLYKWLFNFAQLPLVTYGVGYFVSWMRETDSASGTGQPEGFGVLFAQALAGGVAYFALNTGTVALAVALMSQRPFFELWKRNFALFSLANIVNESTAAVIFVLLKPVNVVILATIIPPALVVYYAYKVNAYRMQQAGNAQIG